MSGCCGPATCCGTAAEDTYDYGPAPFVDGESRTLLGPVPRMSALITRQDRLGVARVRLGIRRSHHRVRPGLYALGEPDAHAPVLVTANYKLSVDAVRSSLTGRNAWLLILDTAGVNVWCAAGKGTFGTAELARRIRESGIEQLVEDRTLVLPQLGAPGVAAHEIRAQTGFRVVYGPVRAADLPAFLDAGMKATDGMRRVSFPASDRLALTGVELSLLWNPRTLATVAALALTAALGVVPWGIVAIVVAAGLLAVLAGGLIFPLALPSVPGRMFALKGAFVGGLVAAAYAVLTARWLDAAGTAALFLGMTTVTSHMAMNFTGASTFTSLSGVTWEMRRAVPVQLTAAVLAIGALVVSVAT